MKTKEFYIVPIIEALANCGVKVSKEVADYFSDYIVRWCREAVIDALKTIKKKSCECKIEFLSSADCDSCAAEHEYMYEICEKLAELKGEKKQ